MCSHSPGRATMTVDVSFPNTTSSAAGMSTVESDAMVIRSPASLCGLLSSSSRVLWYVQSKTKSELGDDVALGTIPWAGLVHRHCHCCYCVERGVVVGMDDGQTNGINFIQFVCPSRTPI
jgi:hypothetical protein